MLTRTRSKIDISLLLLGINESQYAAAMHRGPRRLIFISNYLAIERQASSVKYNESANSCTVSGRMEEAFGCIVGCLVQLGAAPVSCAQLYTPDHTPGYRNREGILPEIATESGACACRLLKQCNAAQPSCPLSCGATIDIHRFCQAS